MKNFPNALPGFLLMILLTVSAFPVLGTTEIESKVNFLRILRGGGQCALPEETFKEDLRLEVHGFGRSGLFSSGRTPLLARVKLKAEALYDSDLTVKPCEKETDVAGCMTFQVTAGKKIGDHYIRISAENDRSRNIIVRMLVGASLEGTEQESFSGSLLEKPISIRIVGADGKPAAGVPVFFSLKSAPGNDDQSKVLTPECLTDREGRASSFVKLGGKTGEYLFSIEAADARKNIFMRPVPVRALGIDVFRVCMNVLIGITFLIYGMVKLSSGLQQVAGENMKKLLAIFSKNGIIAILAGALVTAVVQSSTATTVMVLGFINAGLLTLHQAVGIIFGANIGTTITAQLISFNLDIVALPAIVIGFSLMFLKRRIIKGWGEAIFGFGMLFFGMAMMAGELKLLGAFPSFTHFFSLIDCAPAVAGDFMPIGPILGAMGIGVVAAFTIHSSAAVIGIILALAAGGLINFYTAVPLLVGTNIGTTITAWIAAIPANRVAKQAAMAHLLFNLLGALLMLILFYIPYGENHIPIFLYFVNAITPGNAFAAIPQNLERHIAMAHTLFNLLTVAAIFPFLSGFSKLCERIIPGETEVPQSRPLEPLLLNTPAMAIAQTIQEIRRMTGKSWDMVRLASADYFMNGKVQKEGFEKLAEEEEFIDQLQRDITDYLVQITRQRLTGHQAAVIPILMHSTNDAERIADHAENILRLTKRLAKTKTELSDVAKKDLTRLLNALCGWAIRIGDELSAPQPRNYPVFNGDEEEHQLRRMVKKIEQSHIERRNTGKCSMDSNVIYIELLWEMERVGGHLVNILERTPEIQRYLCLK